MDGTTHAEYSVSFSEKQQIIKYYALRICLVEEEYENRVRDIMNRIWKNEIGQDDAGSELEEAAKKTAHTLSRLMIEQFYNTGQEEMFDRAMMLYEDIELDDYSILGIDEGQSRGDERPVDEGVVVPYEGLFIYFSKDAGPRTVKKIRVIYRDPDDVEKINKKLERGRMLLNVDEITLGKKYYQGLCMRTHYH